MSEFIEQDYNEHLLRPKEACTVFHFCPRCGRPLDPNVFE